MTQRLVHDYVRLEVSSSALDRLKCRDIDGMLRETSQTPTICAEQLSKFGICAC